MEARDCVLERVTDGSGIFAKNLQKTTNDLKFSNSFDCAEGAELYMRASVKETSH